VRSIGGLRWQAALALVACCAVTLLAAPAVSAQLKPEPAPKGPRGPAPEPQSPQPPAPVKRATPPPAPTPPAAPPPAAQPPPAPPSSAAVTPPPAVVTPPPAVVTPPAPPPAAVKVTPPAPAVRRVIHKKQPAKGAKRENPKKHNGVKKVGEVATAGALLAREKASSVDGTLLAGGLALFFLVLADTVLLTVSTGVFRART
jgi:hypothetical protein